MWIGLAKGVTNLVVGFVFVLAAMCIAKPLTIMFRRRWSSSKSRLWAAVLAVIVVLPGWSVIWYLLNRIGWNGIPGGFLAFLGQFVGYVTGLPTTWKILGTPVEWGEPRS